MRGGRNSHTRAALRRAHEREIEASLAQSHPAPPPPKPPSLISRISTSFAERFLWPKKKMQPPAKPDHLVAYRKILAPSDVDMVIYHGGCRDGFGAAWAAHKALRKPPTFLPAVHTDRNEPPDVTGKNVLIVDFAYSLGATKRMIQQAQNLVILDHHKTSCAVPPHRFPKLLLDMLELKDIPNAYFDLHKSGARLAWEFFHPEEKTPQLVEYIEDRDLWKWELPKSKEFSAGFYALPMTFDTFNDLANQPAFFEKTIEKGSTINDLIDTLVKRAARRAVKRKWLGFTVNVVNSSFWPSEVGHEVAQTADFGLVWQQNALVIDVALRSVRNDIDVGAIAQQFGGGGHAKASGFIWRGDIESLLAKRL